MKPHVRLKQRLEAGGGMPSIGAATAFRGASQSDRDVAGWIASRGSADSDLLPELGQLVYRQRDIHRNNGVAHSGVQTIVDNVVGTGLRLSARPDYAALGRDKAWAIQWSKVAQSYFHGWWHSTACHAGDTMTGDQLTAQVMFSKINNGASLTLPLWLPERGDGYATKLQTVESDRLSQPFGQPETRYFRGGIEFDEYGAPQVYNIRKGHPGEIWIDPLSTGFTEWERVPRRTPFGRLRVIHDYDQERSGQSRGVPLMASILPQFKNLDRYTQAELQAAVMNAMIFASITTPLSADDIVDLFSKDPEAYLKARQENAVRMQSGSLLALHPGDKLDPFLPARPATQFGNFTENIYRIIAVGLDMPYELLLKDFSKTTYSSARAAMLEAWRSFTRRRDWLGTMWMDPIYGLFLEELVNDGRVDAPDFYANRAAYQRCRWIGPGRGWVDPVKEAQAAGIRVSNNLSTLEDECAEQGKDWEEVLEQKARERDKMDELELTAEAPVYPLDTSSDAPPGGGKPPGNGPPQDDQQQDDGAPKNNGRRRAAARLPAPAAAATQPDDPAVAQLVATARELTEAVRLQSTQVAARPQEVHIAQPPPSTDATVLAEAMQSSAALMTQAVDAMSTAFLRMQETMARPRRSELEVQERDDNGFTRRAVKTETLL